MDPVPVPVSEFVKSAPFWKEHATSMPLVEEVIAFIKSIDLKTYSYAEAVPALLAALREHMTANVPEDERSLEEIAKSLQEILSEAVADVKADVKDIVVAVQEGEKKIDAAVAEVRAADSPAEQVAAVTNVVEATAETTEKAAAEVQGAAKTVADASNAVEKAAIEAGLDEKRVKEVTDAVESAAATVADIADKAEDVAKTVQAVAPVVEQHCGFLWGLCAGLCRKKAPKA